MPMLRMCTWMWARTEMCIARSRNHSHMLMVAFVPRRGSMPPPPPPPVRLQLSVLRWGQGRGRVVVRSALPLDSVFACNHVEEEGEKVLCKGGAFSFAINPFEIKTFRLIE